MCNIDPPHLPAIFGRPAIDRLSNAEIAVSRNHYDGVPRHQFKHGMSRSHTGGERKRKAAFQSTDRLLKGLPGGIAVAAIPDLGGTHLMRTYVGRGKDDRRVERCIHYSLRAPGSNCHSLRT
jgi:hypothetical protein